MSLGSLATTRNKTDTPSPAFHCPYPPIHDALQLLHIHQVGLTLLPAMVELELIAES
jgi:hypothetical protein